MPLNLDTCIAGVFVPGNIGASSGLPPVVAIIPSLVGPAPSIEETASASDTIGFFMGVLLHEAAAATATVNAIFAGTTGIVETATATATVAVQVSVTHTASVTETAEALDQFFEQRPIEFDDTITETVTATDTVVTGNIHVVSISEAASATDAPAGGVPTVLNPADKTSGITLSGGNLTAVASGSSQAVRSNRGQASGKFYFEWLVNNDSNGADTGIATSSMTLANWINQVNGLLIDTAVGSIRYNGSSTGVSLGTISNGQRICCAVDMTNLRVWMRVNGGNWNGNATYNPATNVGGVNISSSFTGLAAFAMAGGGHQSSSTSNFGATAFVFTPPSGFSAGPT